MSALLPSLSLSSLPPLKPAYSMTVIITTLTSKLEAVRRVGMVYGLFLCMQRATLGTAGDFYFGLVLVGRLRLRQSEQQIGYGSQVAVVVRIPYAPYVPEDAD